jgi:hypothetical protein
MDSQFLRPYKAKRLFSRRQNSEKKAVFPIIAAVLIFGIVFTSIFGYYYVTAQYSQEYQNALKSHDATVAQTNSQDVILYGSLTGTQILDIDLNNSGIAVSVVAYWIYNGTSSQVIQYENTSTTTKLPLYIAQGQSVVYSNTNISVTNLYQQYIIRVLTSLGQVFVGSFPSQQLVSSSINSLVAAGIGSLRMTFSSFSWYSYVSGPGQGACDGGGYGCDSDGDFYQLCSDGQACGMAVDGSAYNTASCNAVTSCAMTLTTANPEDLIILTSYETSTSVHVSSISDTSGLSWNLREKYTSSGVTEEWYAVAPDVLSSDVITVKYSGSATAGITATAIYGTDTASPFDTHSGLPVTGSGTSTNPSVSVSTSNSNDLILGIVSCTSSPTISTGNGFTQAAGPSSPNCNGDRAIPEFQDVESTESGMGVGFSLSSKVSYNMIADAIAPEPWQIDMAQPEPGTLVPQGQNSSSLCSFCGSMVPIAFSVNITNDDPSQADLVINSHTNLWVIETCDTSTFTNDCPQGNPVYVFYVMDVNPTTGVITSTNEGSFSQINIPYGTSQTLYFGAAYDLSTSSFQSMSLSTDDSLYAGNNLAYYGEFAVFLLFGGTKIAPTDLLVYGQNIPFQTTIASDNLGWVAQTPILCTSGTPTSFSLQVNNSIFSGYSVSQITVNASALSSVSATSPTGWSDSISNGWITWTNSNSLYLINPSSSLTFSWSGTAPSTSSSPELTFPTLVTWNGGGFQNLQSSSACFD